MPTASCSWPTAASSARSTTRAPTTSSTASSDWEADMRRVILGGLWARRRRLAGTSLAVFLGTAFLAGTLMLSGTLRANFDRLFSDANAGTDAVVRAAASVDTDRGPVRAPIDA